MSILFAAVASLTLLFLVLVLFRNFKSPSYYSYFLTGLFWILVLAGILFTLRWGLSRAGNLFLSLGVVFLPAQAAHSSFCFARQSPGALLKRWGVFLGVIYSLGIFFFVQALHGHIFDIDETGIYDYLLVAFSIPGQLYLGFLLVTTLVALINLESTYRLSKGADRNRLKLPLIFTFLTYAWVIYAATSSFVLRKLPFWILQAGFLLVLLALFFTGLYLLRRRADQPAIYVGRRLAYSSIAFVFVGLYLVFIGLVASFIPKLGGNLQIFISVLAGLMVFLILVILAFWETWKKRLERWLERLLYPEAFDFREEWKKFSENISALLDPGRIQTEIIKVVGENLKLENLSIMAFPGRSDELSLTYPKNHPYSQDLSLSREDPFWGWILRYGETVEKSQIKSMLESFNSGSKIKQILEETGAVVVTPFIANRELVGLLQLGPKEQGDAYTHEEFDLLNAISGQAALALLNARIGQELILSREMESFHKFSAFVIHDLKNSISMLSMLLANAQGNLNKPQFQSMALETVDQAVRKMKSLVEKLSAPPEGSTLVLSLCDLNQIAARTIKNLKLELLPNLKVETEFAQLPQVNCDQQQIEKVLQNLLLNAAEALPRGGKIKIKTELEGAAPAGGVRISLSDNGVGISSEYLRQKLFKPFASTKKSGLGIGLYQCKEIVEQHGGKIWAESAENQGTTFYIFLPFGEELQENEQHRESVRQRT
ncbi:MAG: hypothetical protein A2Z27_02605 [candidate division Zixibacteria bacterium RBG_16_50_21]|nr:MAG: hypothetical protein A2Z27_02605 [candidate division Zixibacteria bacterium RBG_16_50_21]